MDLSKLKPSDWMVGGGAIVFLIAMVLPWYGFGDGGFSVNNTGFSYFLSGIIPLLLIIGVFVLTVLPKLVDSINLPDPIGPLPRLQAALAAAGLAAILVVLRLLIASDNVGSVDVGQNADRKFGLILAVLAVLAVAAGAFIKNQEGDDVGIGPGGPAGGPPTPF